MSSPKVTTFDRYQLLQKIITSIYIIEDDLLKKVLMKLVLHSPNYITNLMLQRCQLSCVYKYVFFIWYINLELFTKLWIKNLNYERLLSCL